MDHYEEHTDLSAGVSWLFLILFSIFILGWGMLLMCMVMDAPREWSFGVLPDTPGESIYSTVVPAPSAGCNVQVAPLPGALPTRVGDNDSKTFQKGPSR
jgi:hypothetical protein